ncbi:hypothetical protein THAOC_22910 [Thalassiosira oceanica]|uniref:Uncharacterized protein n=1 Tax=Thalassiosira oceanica TaxID=159749 RepID=K0S880_THAOC|nr:hypothetical protein THAOC_22910 [Thalassiosira oceanica]|eukprot:EJK57086.1 hypothetical protein THAOC_22910 [Thalassiosira oceanica]
MTSSFPGGKRRRPRGVSPGRGRAGWKRGPLRRGRVRVRREGGRRGPPGEGGRRAGSGPKGRDERSRVVPSIQRSPSSREGRDGSDHGRLGSDREASVCRNSVGDLVPPWAKLPDAATPAVRVGRRVASGGALQVTTVDEFRSPKLDRKKSAGTAVRDDSQQALLPWRAVAASRGTGQRRGDGANGAPAHGAVASTLRIDLAVSTAVRAARSRIARRHRGTASSSPPATVPRTAPNLSLRRCSSGLAQSE